MLRVLANSPAANAGLEPWFDYICGVNSVKLVSSHALQELMAGPNECTSARFYSEVCSGTEDRSNIHSLFGEGTGLTR